ncbi:MAG: bifunctional folylpolyglutamate synthase/dihydrofolate synthase [Desulfitibacter sp. BRH_c19]|nr:MAG: bifunctional folylpolyglutamate synthase/dihydrofolate synthase [Desulfitibacter sp. BRH_c19]
MNYQEALDYLRNLTTFGMNFGLDRILKLLELLGNPQKTLKVVHIGGTNGKGSTAAMLSSVLAESGYNVGMFTSPHIHSYRERFRINGEMISRENATALITFIKPLLEKMVQEGYEHPTEFEVNTAMAFKYFQQEAVDLLVLEVGLGGEIDSTNVVNNPLLSIITNVAMDHMDYLGNSIKEIATVKSGIIKENRPVITGVDKVEALEVIEQKSNSLESPLYILGRDFSYQTSSLGPEGSVFTVTGIKDNYPKINLPLLGEHQGKNLAMVLVAVELLQEMGFAKITKDTLLRGLQKVVWNARLEIFKKDPLIIIDVAHNVDGIMTLKDAVENIFPDYQLTLVIGMLADKEREKVVQIIAPLARRIVVTKPLSPRAGNWEQLKFLAEKYCSEVLLEPNIGDALKIALTKVGSLPKEMIIITGSFYMVSEARQWLQENA